MEEIDFYRIIKICAILATGWVVQVVGLSTFRTEMRNGPPKMIIVNFGTYSSDANSQRTFEDLAREKGWDMHASFVTPSEAQMRITDYERKKWISLFAGIGGAFLVFVAAYKIWEDWITAIACVLVGPVGIAWGFQRSNKG